ncbi:hypothetical protein LTS10_006842 [Elasticomyces elasticus]|nr:hypothetical protein LTS10_006842 [Elasticomyces elasticus]
MEADTGPSLLAIALQTQSLHHAKAVSEHTKIAGNLQLGMELYNAGRLQEAVAPLKAAEIAILGARERQQGLIRVIESSVRLIRHDVVMPARRVIDLPELAELIFMQLDIEDLLRMMRVDQPSRTTILSSPALQRKLHLRPDANAHLRLLPAIRLASPRDRRSNNRGLVTISHGSLPYCTPWSGAILQDREQEIRHMYSRVKVHFHHSLPRLGDRIRSMLVSQPPVYEMEVRLGCCSPFGQHAVMRVPNVGNTGGLTIGGLQDAAKRLMEQHANCPFAALDCHDYVGNLKTDVRFEGIVKLRDDDATVREAINNEKRAVRIEQGWAEKRSKLEEFCRSKRLAWAQDRPIPTFEEFSSANAGR